MLKTRIIASIVLLPVVVAVIAIGGMPYQLAIALILATGTWELNRLTKHEGFAPSLVLSWAILGIILLSATWPDILGPGLATGILLAMLASLYHFHHGNHNALNNFALTLGIPLYLGWLGMHLLVMRNLPDGQWWTLLVLPCTFATDTGAYFAGTRLGRHKMDPKVSPGKTWEGYIGGALAGMVAGLVLAALWQSFAPAIQLWHGLVIGLAIGLVTPIGDLAVSAFKRQAGVKDTSRLIPGHGGLMDRLDTVLIAAALGYYLILLLTA